MEAGYENLQYDAGVDDVGFVSTLIDKLTVELKIDKNHIYATGASNGAVFTQLLAVELSDKIAVEPLRPVSVLLMMSDTDPIMNFNGIAGTFLSANNTVEYWLKSNNITTADKSVYLPQTTEGDTTRIKLDKYDGGSLETKVLFYTVEGGGHTWPGGIKYASEAEVGKVSYQINASEEIWDYFKDIELPNITMKAELKSYSDSITVNGASASLGNNAYIDSKTNRTMVPVLKLAKALGIAAVQNDDRVTLARNDVTVTLASNSSDMLVNGQTINMDCSE